MTDPAPFTAKMSEVDEAMTGVDGGESHLPLSEDETRVLELYDKLQELRLEIAIINAQQAGKVTFTCQARAMESHFAHPDIAGFLRRKG